MPTDTGVATQQALLFPGSILLLYLPLCASSYVSLPTRPCPFTMLVTEITSQLLDLLLSQPWCFFLRKTANSVLDRSFHTSLPWALFAHIFLSTIRASD